MSVAVGCFFDRMYGQAFIKECFVGDSERIQAGDGQSAETL